MLLLIDPNGEVTEIHRLRNDQSVEERICQVLEIADVNAGEVFEPRYLTRNRFSEFPLLMIGRMVAEDEQENFVGDILSGYPEKRWCRGPLVLYSNVNGEYADLPDAYVNAIGVTIRAISSMTREA